MDEVDSGLSSREAPPISNGNALRNRNFLVYAVASGISSLGMWVQRLAVGWLSWELSQSELWVGAIAFSLFGPTLLLSPFFGVYVDRLEPLRTASVLNGVMAFWAFVLAVLSLCGMLAIELLFIISILTGISSAAFAPVRISIIPAIVPRELMASAIGLNSMIFNASRLVGPAIAGLVLVVMPIAAAFMVNALSYVPLIYALAKAPAKVMQPRAKEPFFRQLAEGIAYTAKHPYIRTQLLLTAWAGLFGRSILEVLPIYSDRYYSAAIEGLAILSATAGAGALLAAFLSSRGRLDSRQLQRRSILLALVNAAALLILPLRDNLWLGAACIAFVGFGSTGSAVLSQTLVQFEVEDAVRGRVSSLWGMASMGGAAFGGLVLSVLLKLFDIPNATLLTATLALAMPLAAWIAIHGRKAE